MNEIEEKTSWQIWKYGLLGGIIGLLFSPIFSFLLIKFPLFFEFFIPSIIVIFFVMGSDLSPIFVFIGFWSFVWGIIFGLFYKKKLLSKFNIIKRNDKKKYFLKLFCFVLFCFALMIFITIIIFALFFALFPLELGF